MNKLSLIFLANLIWACNPQPNNLKQLPTLSETMDGIVTRLYENFDKHSLDTISHSFILNYISQEEKEALAHQYWIFDVNIPVTVSVIRDKDQEVIPFWLEERGFTLTDMEVKNRHSTYEVWQKEFNEGRIHLGINGFDKHRPVYLVAVAPQDPDANLEIAPVFPEQQHFEPLQEGAFTYHDWDELTLEAVPEALRGQQLMTTIRGRAREAHVIGAFRNTKYPSSSRPDQLLLTWSDDPSTTMDIQWRTHADIKESKVKYWLKSTDDTLSLAGTPNLLEDRMLQNDRYIHRYTAKIEDLQPNSTYGYLVETEEGSRSPVASFTTAPSEKSPFSFIWFGDVHNTDQWGDLIDLANQQHQDHAFHIIAGDLVNTGLHRDDWDQLFAYGGSSFAQKPLLAVPGNHDSQDGLGAWMYEEMLSFPENGPEELPKGRTFSFTYQNALFLMVDGTLNLQKQTDWLVSTLEKSEEDWKILTIHFPPFNAVEPYDSIIDEWAPLFEKYQVDFVLSGHYHYYMRSKPMLGREVSDDPTKGTYYMISIGTRGKNEDAPKEYYAEVQFPASFLYQKVDIDSKTLSFKTFNLEGKVVDTFTLTK
ncbi:purple acid phosphatase family protein [Pleomorphovibrio marinus]|uniref:purple acid phosphatase family protein n=1 Tax=Pleomorphovibrio marinus TaxID=2164132 RepID=UPI000E0BB3F4|nr:metallophosphoesterase family protein [Pleomorphovibrio marinus]